MIMKKGGMNKQGQPTGLTSVIFVNIVFFCKDGGFFDFERRTEKD